MDPRYVFKWINPNYNLHSVYLGCIDKRGRCTGRLAPLWPLLGILAEVLILCAIIGWHERAVSKRKRDEQASEAAAVGGGANRWVGGADGWVGLANRQAILAAFVRSRQLEIKPRVDASIR